jgi:KUP system potassium uptake protein
MVNYLGQGAWLMTDYLPGTEAVPFFSIMPGWFLFAGVIISTAAAIIASQALISGSFTLISEAVSLNFWPKIRINNPTYAKGQVYLPFVNWLLWIMCSLVVIFFRESSNMEAAYGLAITITMIMTTLLLSYYLYQTGTDRRIAIALMLFFLAIECSFLVANLHKFWHGGWFTLFLASLYFIIMLGWYFGRKIKNRHISFIRLADYFQLFRDLVNDKTAPKTASNIAYIIKANRVDQVESKVIHSIFRGQPKRADRYWFLHVDRVDEPNRFDYRVTHIIPGILVRIDFFIGFKVDPKINLYFREALEDMVKSGEIILESGFDSLRKRNFAADFKFILIERIMLRDYKLNNTENFILSIQGIVSRLSLPDDVVLHLDPTITTVEKVPIIIDRPVKKRIEREL